MGHPRGLGQSFMLPQQPSAFARWSRRGGLGPPVGLALSLLKPHGRPQALSRQEPNTRRIGRVCSWSPGPLEPQKRPVVLS
jgi:hypothetical protein